VSVRRRVIVGLALAMAAALAVFYCERDPVLRVTRASRPPGHYQPREEAKLAGSAEALAAFRLDALARAQVWRLPPQPIERVDFTRNLDRDFGSDDVVACQYLLEDSKGWTPKFDCVLPDGEVLRVKYGDNNGEVFAEVVATRFLAALGFGADRVSVVRAVRCFGCPPAPNPRWGDLYNRFLQARGGYREFDPAVVERPLPGTSVNTKEGKGWGWNEIDAIDPARGGASRAEVDALRLLAVFLAHWDNKPENQRLVCLDEPRKVEDGCTRPFAMIQDVGATFGPRRLDLARWKETPVWADARACRVSLSSMPYEGGTFPDTSISEGGRRFLAERLARLSRAQIRALFSGARLESYAELSAEGRDAEAWADAFLDRVRQIARAGPCPER
jgi:hypothetical protein